MKMLLDLSKIHGFTTEIVKPIYQPNSKKLYYSTLIREAIRLGQMEKVCSLLGRPWSMDGTVIKGHMRGRKIGFPTHKGIVIRWVVNSLIQKIC